MEKVLKKLKEWGASILGFTNSLKKSQSNQGSLGKVFIPDPKQIKE